MKNAATDRDDEQFLQTDMKLQAYVDMILASPVEHVELQVEDETVAVE